MGTVPWTGSLWPGVHMPHQLPWDSCVPETGECTPEPWCYRGIISTNNDSDRIIVNNLLIWIWKNPKEGTGTPVPALPQWPCTAEHQAAWSLTMLSKSRVFGRNWESVRGQLCGSDFLVESSDFAHSVDFGNFIPKPLAPPMENVQLKSGMLSF